MNGKQRLVNKAISPADVVRALQAGSITIAQAQQMFEGVIPIGDLNGIAALYDINKQVIQPLIWAEKQWTLDRVDPRNGMVQVTVPVGTAPALSITGEIEVPADEVWYLCEHEITIAQAATLTAGDILVNFLVSSFPKVVGVDKAYYLATDPQVYLTTLTAGVPGPVASGSLLAGFAEIAAGAINDHRLVPIGHTAGVPDLGDFKRDFRDGDELNTELRLVGGDILTLVATVATAAVAVAPVVVTLRVWGRVGKLLVS